MAEVGKGNQPSTIRNYTMEPKNGASEDDLPFQLGEFFGSMVNFPGFKSKISQAKPDSLSSRFSIDSHSTPNNYYAWNFAKIC